MRGHPEVPPVEGIKFSPSSSVIQVMQVNLFLLLNDILSVTAASGVGVAFGSGGSQPSTPTLESAKKAAASREKKVG